MNYWVVSPNVSDDKSLEGDWKKAISELKRVFMGYSSKDSLGKIFKNKISIGDIVLIAQGSNSNKRVYLAGEAKSNAKWEHLAGTPGPVQNIKLQYTLSKEYLESLNLNFEGCAYGKSNQPAAIYKLKPSENANDKRITDKLFSNIQKVKLKMELNNYIKLLNYKKQIILQGPPGTGKTYTAKQVAKKLTDKTKKINPLKKIESFFKNFKVTEDIEKHRKHVDNLKNTFLNKFKKDQLKSLELEDYALGTENLDNFCYWIEYKLTDTGKYTGQANKGKIYWDADNEEYRKSGFIKDVEDDREAMQEVAKLLDRIVSEQDGNFPIGKGFVLKILNTYYPEKYFPINSEACIDNLLKLIKEESPNLNYIEKNKKVQSFFQRMKEKFNTDVTNYEFMYFLFDNFNLKGEVLIEDDELVTEGERTIIQFHPSYTYEDFVRGITVKSNPNGDIKYETENKLLAEFSQKALDNKSANYVLIIDEINRANLPSVLGELIYGLEYRGESVDSMYALDDGDNKITIPENLYIIGTMNTADRSVGHIDYAIRRRFAFVEMLPKILKDSNLNFRKDKFEEVSKLFVQDIETKSLDLEASKHLSPEFEDRPQDVWLGHSYFIEQKDEQGNPIDFQLRVQYEIIPILEEYMKDGILQNTDEVKDIINGLKKD